MFFNEIIESLSIATIKYGTIIRENNCLIINSTNVNNSTNNINQLNNRNTSFNNTQQLDIYQKFIITTNNLERVRESLKSFLTELEYHKLKTSAEKLDKIKIYEANHISIEYFINNANDYLIQIIDQTMEIIIKNKVLINFLKYHDSLNSQIFLQIKLFIDCY